MFAVFLTILVGSLGIVEAAPINNQVQEVVESPLEAPQTDPTEKPVEPEQERTVEEEVALTQPPAPKPQVVHPVGCENYRAELSKYSWNVDVALQVMRAESGCNPNAVGDQRVIGGIYAPSCGLFQIRTLSGRPDCETLKNPITNIQWAYKLYSASGWQPWSVCKNGMVSCY